MRVQWPSCVRVSGLPALSARLLSQRNAGNVRVLLRTQLNADANAPRNRHAAPGRDGDAHQHSDDADRVAYMRPNRLSILSRRRDDVLARRQRLLRL